MLRTFLDRLYLFSGYLAGLFLIAIFVLMMLLSAGRPIGLNVPAGDEIVSWCMAATAFLGLAHTFRSGEMIRVGLLIDRLGRPHAPRRRDRRARDRRGFIGFFAWHAAWMTYDSWRFNDMAQGVFAMPLWIPQLGYSRRARHPARSRSSTSSCTCCAAFRRATKGQSPQTAEEVVERAMQSGV